MNLRSLIFFLVVLIGVAANAQRCKFIVDEQDPITDDFIRTIKTRITGPISGVTPYYYFYYSRVGSTYTFKVEVADYGVFTHSIPAKSELIIRLSDGALIRINSLNEALPKPIKDYGQELTAYEIEYALPEEEMAKITKAGITFIRATDFKNTFSDQKIPTPITTQSMENAVCVFND
ncbi:MAG: hypothetical protein ABJP45_14785 [Cyclobacteriaceae bacterium]